MKILRIFLIFFTTVFTHQALAETEAACKRNSDGEIIVANDNGQNIVTDIEENTGDSCKEAPDFYKLKFYRFGLCKSNPIANSTNDFSSCSYLVNSDIGVSHVITYPSTALLNTNSTMAAGTYSFLLLLLNNGLEQKHTETFSLPLVGSSGTGKTCWTLEKATAYGGNSITGVTTVSPNPNTRSTLAMDCGAASEADPKYTTEIFETLGDGGYNNTDIDGGVYVKLLQDDNLTLATSVDNSKRIAVALPVAITTKSTSSYEIGFKVVGSSSVDLHEDSGTLTSLKIGADPFQVTFAVN